MNRRKFTITGSASALAAMSGLAFADIKTPAGFKPLFNGKNLDGWHPVPRLPMKKFYQTDIFRKDYEAYKIRSQHLGKWEVKDGGISGGQNPAGSRLGSYLVTNRMYADFELLVDAKPDWPADTGIMLRSAPGRGNLGYQVLVDHRPKGSIGGFFGNGIGSYRIWPFEIDLDKDENGNIKGLKAVKASEEKTANLSYACSSEEFLKTWKFNDWNTFRIRCVGSTLPKLTVWINGVKISELDTSKISWEGYRPDYVAKLIGPMGHIGFEVHDNDPKMDWDRWGKGSVCRWKNIFIKEL